MVPVWPALCTGPADPQGTLGPRSRASTHPHSWKPPSAAGGGKFPREEASSTGRTTILMKPGCPGKKKPFAASNFQRLTHTFSLKFLMRKMQNNYIWFQSNRSLEALSFCHWLIMFTLHNESKSNLSAGLRNKGITATQLQRRAPASWRNLSKPVLIMLGPSPNVGRAGMPTAPSLCLRSTLRNPPSPDHCWALQQQRRAPRTPGSRPKCRDSSKKEARLIITGIPSSSES